MKRTLSRTALLWAVPLVNACSDGPATHESS
jgi:hypothetical protein